MIHINKERKYILIIGIVLLFFGAVYRFSPNIKELFSENEDTILKRKKLIKYQQMVLKKDQLKAELAFLNKEMIQAESAVFTSSTPSLAAVDIQNILKNIARQGGFEIKSMRFAKPKFVENTEYIAIPIQVSLNVNTRQLKDILYKIETSSKILKITNIRINLPNIRRKGMVQSTFTLEGFMKNHQTPEE